MRTIGQEFRISSATTGTVLRAPEAVVAPDGSVLLASYGMDAFSGGSTLNVLRTDPATGAQTALLTLPIADLGFEGLNRGFAGSDIAVRADGSFAVAFTGYVYAFSGGRSITDSALYVQTFSAAGTPVGGPQELARWNPGIGGNIARNTRIEAAGDGYVLTWTMNDDANAEQINALRLGAGGAPVGAAGVLEARGKPDLLALPGGDALAAWTRAGSIITQVIAADGSIGAAQTLTGRTVAVGSSAANDVELRRLDDGRIFALYESTNATVGLGLALQQLDAQGAAVGDARLVVPTQTGAGTVTFGQSGPEARARFDLMGLPGGMMVLAYAFSPATGTRNYDIGRHAAVARRHGD